MSTRLGLTLRSVRFLPPITGSRSVSGTGLFGARMQLELVKDVPVALVLS
jgi:D-Tyr-tRNAtyr deacylase